MSSNVCVMISIEAMISKELSTEHVTVFSWTRTSPKFRGWVRRSCWTLLGCGSVNTLEGLGGLGTLHAMKLYNCNKLTALLGLGEMTVLLRGMTVLLRGMTVLLGFRKMTVLLGLGEMIVL